MMLVPLMHLITVAQAMILASKPESEWNGIFQNTAGIVFLGTPHRGSSSANEAAAYFRLIPFVHTPPLVRLLHKDSSLLAHVGSEELQPQRNAWLDSVAGPAKPPGFSLVILQSFSQRLRLVLLHYFNLYSLLTMYLARYNAYRYLYSII